MARSTLGVGFERAHVDEALYTHFGARVSEILDEVHMHRREPAAVVPALVEDTDEIDDGRAPVEERYERTRGTNVGRQEIDAG
jgi:hypothetical protein